MVKATARRISAPAGTGRGRYIRDRVVEALFRDEPVLLVSPDPQHDPFGEHVAELRGLAVHPDAVREPRERGAIGGNLTYISFAPAADAAAPCDWSHDALVFRMEAWLAPSRVLFAREKRGLVLLDGCDVLQRPPLAAQRQRILAFAQYALTRGHRLLAVGPDARDTEWLENIRPGVELLQLKPRSESGRHGDDDDWLLSSLWGGTALSESGF